MAQAESNAIAKRTLSRRTGSCSASNIKIRKEWYVSIPCSSWASLSFSRLGVPSV
jgi:hypothetical protein